MNPTEASPDVNIIGRSPPNGVHHRQPPWYFHLRPFSSIEMEKDSVDLAARNPARSPDIHRSRTPDSFENSRSSEYSLPVGTVPMKDGSCAVPKSYGPYVARTRTPDVQKTVGVSTDRGIEPSGSVPMKDGAGVPDGPYVIGTGAPDSFMAFPCGSGLCQHQPWWQNPWAAPVAETRTTHKAKALDPTRNTSTTRLGRI